MWCGVLSCIGKMTLAEPRGFLLLKPSAPPTSLCSSSFPQLCLPPGDETFRRGQCPGFNISTARVKEKKKSGFCTRTRTFSQLAVHFPFCLQTKEHSVHSCLLLEQGLIDSAKVQVSQVGLFRVTCRGGQRGASVWWCTHYRGQ